MSVPLEPVSRGAAESAAAAARRQRRRAGAAARSHSLLRCSIGPDFVGRHVARPHADFLAYRPVRTPRRRDVGNLLSAGGVAHRAPLVSSGGAAPGVGRRQRGAGDARIPDLRFPDEPRVRGAHRAPSGAGPAGDARTPRCRGVRYGAAAVGGGTAAGPAGAATTSREPCAGLSATAAGATGPVGSPPSARWYGERSTARRASAGAGSDPVSGAACSAWWVGVAVSSPCGPGPSLRSSPAHPSLRRPVRSDLVRRNVAVAHADLPSHGAVLPSGSRNHRGLLACGRVAHHDPPIRHFVVKSSGNWGLIGRPTTRFEWRRPPCSTFAEPAASWTRLSRSRCALRFRRRGARTSRRSCSAPAASRPRRRRSSSASSPSCARCESRT